MSTDIWISESLKICKSVSNEQGLIILINFIINDFN